MDRAAPIRGGMMGELRPNYLSIVLAVSVFTTAALSDLVACSSPNDGTGGSTSTGGATSASTTTTTKSATNGSGNASSSTADASSSSGGTCTSPHCLLWTRVFTGAASKVEQPQLVIDAANHIWIVARLTGAVDFGLGILNTVKTAPLLLELDPNGNTVRAELVSTSDEAYFSGIARSTTGMMFAWGYHRAPLDFGNGVTLATNNVFDPFLVAYDASGAAQWVKTGSAQPFTVAADSAGSVILAGNIAGGFDGHTIPVGTSSGFAMKFDAAGVWQWTAALGQTMGSFPFAATADDNGNVIVGVDDVFTYQFASVSKLDKVTGALMWSTAPPSPYSFGWVKTMTAGPSGSARMTGFAVTGNDGHGGWAGPTYVLDVDATGVADTSKSVVFQQGDLPQLSAAIAVDGQGRTAIAGIFSGTLVLDATYTQNVPYPVTGGPTDIFFAVLQDGTPPTPLWSQHVGAFGKYEPSIAFDGTGNLLFATHFTGTVDLGAGPIDSTDAVAVAKYGP